MYFCRTAKWASTGAKLSLTAAEEEITAASGLPIDRYRFVGVAGLLSHDEVAAHRRQHRQAAGPFAQTLKLMGNGCGRLSSGDKTPAAVCS